MARYQYKRLGYLAPPELSGAGPGRYSVAIVGAGPIGLALAIDLALQGISSVLLDDNDMVSRGSRAICWAKRTLEIFDRLGVGDRMLAKGVTWKIGRVYHRDRELYSFDLQPEAAHKMPAFINLQQYYVEEYLVDRVRQFPELIQLRFLNRVTGVETKPDHVRLHVETPDGPYDLEAAYVVACDGARSTLRGLLDLDLKGRRFEERFLIADIEMQADFPADRRFWFEPTFHSGQSALLHKQPDDLYRIDLHLGPGADPQEETRHEKVVPRIKAIVGERPFEIDTVSVYSFQCSRLDRFVHGRVIFAGDSAHVVSPFGARGGNGGIQDVDALGWRLAALIRGEAPQSLLEVYNDERLYGADENIRNSLRTTSFMTPSSEMEELLRRAVFDLSTDMPFARRLINSGRLSLPCSLEGFYGPESHAEDAPLAPGRVALDAPLERGGQPTWLLNHLGGGFTLVTFGGEAVPAIPGIKQLQVGTRGRGLVDREGYALARYGQGLSYLFRPDQHVCATFRTPDPSLVRAAVAAELTRGT